MMRNLGTYVAVLVCVVAVTVGTAATASAQEAEADTGQELRETDGSQERFDRLNLEEPTNLARAELVVGQTAHGFVLGVQACDLLDCFRVGPRATIGALTLGAGAGLGGSLLATSDGITSGQASAINSGTLWGAWMGGMSSMLGDVDSGGVMALLMTGQLAGLGAGWGLSEALRPTAGDVSLVTHTGLWAVGYYMLIMGGIVQAEPNQEALAGSLMAVSAAGGLGGGLLASQSPMSRSRVRMITAGGLVGGLLGLAVPFMMVGENLGLRAGSTGVALGGVGGLALSAHLTRNWDEEPEYGGGTASFSIQPTADRDGMMGTVSGTW